MLLGMLCYENLVFYNWVRYGYGHCVGQFVPTLIEAKWLSTFSKTIQNICRLRILLLYPWINGLYTAYMATTGDYGCGTGTSVCYTPQVTYQLLMNSEAFCCRLL